MQIDMESEIAAEAKRQNCQPYDLMGVRWETGYMIIRTSAYAKMAQYKQAKLAGRK